MTHTPPPSAPGSETGPANGSENGLGTAAGKANQLWGDFIPVIGFILT